MGIKTNLGHTDYHRKKELWYNRRPEDRAEDERKYNKKLRYDPLSTIPKEFRTLESNSKSTNSFQTRRKTKLENSSESDCVVVKSEKKSKKIKKEKKKKKKRKRAASSSDDEEEKMAKLAELRRQR